MANYVPSTFVFLNFVHFWTTPAYTVLERWGGKYMFSFLEKAVLGMALLRLLSGCIEIFAALLMVKFNAVDKAMVINSTLAFIGPLILISTTAVGLFGMADKISIEKLLWIIVGVFFILYGVKS